MARILLVDDDRDILTLGRKLLASCGHDVFTAENAFAAIELLESQPFDAVITDANMPQYSGFDLIKTIRRQERHAHLSVIMLTGRRERKDIERALVLGVDDYIVKPVDPPIFLKKVEDLFRKKPAEYRPEIRLAEAFADIEGSITLPIRVRTISEVGLTIESTHKLNEGSALNLDVMAFRQIGIEVPPVKVLSCEQTPNGTWEARLTFCGADDLVRQKLRAWVFASTSRLGKAS